ncbi:hypothetical protein [Geothrix sp. PMB-07]|uniref:hypothetical protein n=1 Tax=Geothrix sp. PMB-07 TaxID=3068640 RepID=UPI0027415A1E|nr:hypothetical protein [Geothrix sp. PMB-07]WLT30913.1 hypothetical protein Q9293_14440 [Geothrix sp. PMB-07]
MRTFSRTILVLAALSSAALAQSPFSIGLNVIKGLDGLTKVTDRPVAFSLDLGYQGILGGTEIPFRASIAYHHFPGAATTNVRHFVSDDPFTTKDTKVSGVDTSLSSFQLAGDIYVPTPIKALKIVSGFSLNKWHTSNPWLTLGHDSDPNANSMASHSNGAEIKFGFRTGIAYEVNECVTLLIRYQFVSLGSTYALDDRKLTKPGVVRIDEKVNPAWIDFGITYRF